MTSSHLKSHSQRLSSGIEAPFHPHRDRWVRCRPTSHHLLDLSLPAPSHRAVPAASGRTAGHRWGGLRTTGRPPPSGHGQTTGPRTTSTEQGASARRARRRCAARPRLELPAAQHHQRRALLARGVRDGAMRAAGLVEDDRLDSRGAAELRGARGDDVAPPGIEGRGASRDTEVPGAPASAAARRAAAKEPSLPSTAHENAIEQPGPARAGRATKTGRVARCSAALAVLPTMMPPRARARVRRPGRGGDRRPRAAAGRWRPGRRRPRSPAGRRARAGRARRGSAPRSARQRMSTATASAPTPSCQARPGGGSGRQARARRPAAPRRATYGSRRYRQHGGEDRHARPDGLRRCRWPCAPPGCRSTVDHAARRSTIRSPPPARCVSPHSPGRAARMRTPGRRLRGGRMRGDGARHPRRPLRPAELPGPPGVRGRAADPRRTRAASAAPTCTWSTARCRGRGCRSCRATRSSARSRARGERVGVPWLGWTCGECRFCRAGRENLCDAARFTGCRRRRRLRRVRGRRRALLLPDPRRLRRTCRPRRCSAPA